MSLMLNCLSQFLCRGFALTLYSASRAKHSAKECALTIILSQCFPGIAGGVEVLSDGPDIRGSMLSRKRDTCDTFEDIDVCPAVGTGHDVPLRAIPVFSQRLIRGTPTAIFTHRPDVA